MTEFLQANGIRGYRTPMGFSANMTTSQFNKLLKHPGVVIVESQRIAVMLYAGRVHYGFFVRWLYAAVESRPVVEARVA